MNQWGPSLAAGLVGFAGGLQGNMALGPSFGLQMMQLQQQRAMDQYAANAPQQAPRVPTAGNPAPMNAGGHAALTSGALADNLAHYQDLAAYYANSPHAEHQKLAKEYSDKARRAGVELMKFNADMSWKQQQHQHNVDKFEWQRERDISAEARAERGELRQMAGEERADIKLSEDIRTRAVGDVEDKIEAYNDTMFRMDTMDRTLEKAAQRAGQPNNLNAGFDVMTRNEQLTYMNNFIKTLRDGEAFMSDDERQLSGGIRQQLQGWVQQLNDSTSASVPGDTLRDLYQQTETIFASARGKLERSVERASGRLSRASRRTGLDLGGLDVDIPERRVSNVLPEGWTPTEAGRSGFENVMSGIGRSASDFIMAPETQENVQQGIYDMHREIDEASKDPFWKLKFPELMY